MRFARHGNLFIPSPAILHCGAGGAASPSYSIVNAGTGANSTSVTGSVTIPADAELLVVMAASRLTTIDSVVFDPGGGDEQVLSETKNYDNTGAISVGIFSFSATAMQGLTKNVTATISGSQRCSIMAATCKDINTTVKATGQATDAGAETSPQNFDSTYTFAAGDLVFMAGGIYQGDALDMQVNGQSRDNEYEYVPASLLFMGLYALTVTTGAGTGVNVTSSGWSSSHRVTGVFASWGA